MTTNSFLLLLTVFLFSFTGKEPIGECYISFFEPSDLKSNDPQRLPSTADKSRTLVTDEGEVQITRTDGYRIQYANRKDAVFVNLKVESCEPEPVTYEENKKKLVENLKYMASHTSGMEAQGVIEKEFRGKKVYGISRNSIENGSTLGIFIFFPGNGVIVYFYFNNLPPETRNFETVEEYDQQRDRFIDEYLIHLETCKK